MEFSTPDAKVADEAARNEALGTVIDKVTDLGDGKDVDIDFLGRDTVAAFSRTLGVARNWAELDLDGIAPMQPEGVQVVPEDEATPILAALRYLIESKRIEPSADGEAAPTLLNDFLPEGEQFQGEKCLGHLWEFRYALAVELEHGSTRGTNVTNNHPLLTGLVVMAHLAEDSLYYARLWVMETQGELFNAQLQGKPADQVRTTLEHLSLAEKHLQARISEKLEKA